MAATQTQNTFTDDEVATIKALLGSMGSQSGAQGISAGATNVPVGSSPEITSDYFQNNPQLLGGQPQGNQGNFQGGNSNPQAQQPQQNQQSQQPQPNAYQKGVNKMLLQAGQQHAQQAIQAGVDPNAIAAHPAMQPAQQMGGATGSWTPDQQTAISNVANAKPQQAQVPTGQSQQPQQQSQSIQDQIDNINQQAALNVAKRNLSMSKPQSFMDRFSDQLAKMSGGVTRQEELTNSGLIQQIAGATPIQPKDVADLNARSYSAAMEAAHNGITAEAQKLTGLEDLYGKEQPNRNAIDIAWGRENANQTLIRKNIEASAENITNHLANLRTLVSNRPTFSSQGMDRQASALAQKIEGGIYKDAKGNTAKYVGGKFIPVTGGK